MRSLSSEVAPAPWRYTTRAPTGIAGRFEDVMVQCWSTRPAYAEHSFCTCTWPLCTGAADPGAADGPLVAAELTGAAPTLAMVASVAASASCFFIVVLLGLG